MVSVKCVCTNIGTVIRVVLRMTICRALISRKCSENLITWNFWRELKYLKTELVTRQKVDIEAVVSYYDRHIMMKTVPKMA